MTLQEARLVEDDRARPEACSLCAEHADPRCPLCGGKGVIHPPLACGFCYQPRWNDESVTWWPLYGPNRLPYCADLCAQYVRSEQRIKRNGGLEVWAAMHDKDLEWFS